MTNQVLNEADDAFKAMKEDWHKRARECTLENLPAFLDELAGYHHDYGTICHAIATAAAAAAHAIDRSPGGGITGFQAGAIMWEFIRQWNYSSNKTGMRILDYDNMLYPQYDDHFEKAISQSVLKNLREQARVLIEKADKEYLEYLEKMDVYRDEITEFVKKYPDYYQRMDHYDHLQGGTSDEWDKYNQKVADGFEFAPQMPHEPLSEKSPVYRHWKFIAGGGVPFGHIVRDD